MRQYCLFSLFFFLFLQSCSFSSIQNSQNLPLSQTGIKEETTKKQRKANDIARSYTAFLHGNQAEQEKHYEQAFAHYKKALGYAPDNRQIFQKVLLMLSFLKRDEELTLTLEDALAKKPEDLLLLRILASTYLLQGKKEESIAIYLHLQEKQPDDEGINTDLALIYFQQEKFSQAVAVLEEFIYRYPGAYGSRILLARIYNQQKNYDKAIAALTPPPHTEKPDPFIYGAIASLYQIQEKDDKAFATLQQGITAHPSSPELLYDLGLLYENQGKHNLALATMKKVLAVHPDYADALNFIGYSWAEGNVNLNQAHSYILRANSIKPDNAFILDSLGWVLYRLGKFNKAEQALQKALILLPENDFILEHLGDVNAALQHYEAAQKYYTRAYRHSYDAQNQRRIEKKIKKHKKNDCK